MIAVGDTVGNYRVVAKLGEGGMGQVFLAEHPIIGSKVAIKAVHSQFARNPEVVSRFVTEARAVNQVGHDHIVSITDFGNTPGGDFYFVMEYLQGQMLSDQIGRVPFPPARSLHIAAQIADALQASHDQGVIHRDLKPGNILLISREATPDFVKVFDFGLAKLIGQGHAPAHSTGAGIVMGTPFYMSPEQCVGNVEVDHRCDIYALGVMLFEMSTGRVPFMGDGYGEVMMRHVNTPPPLARSLVPTLPVELDEILQRALAKDPAQRYQSMNELRAALLDLAGRFSTPPLMVSRTEHSRPNELLAGAGELLHDGRGKASGKHRGLFIAGAAALVTLAAANVGVRHAVAPAVGTPVAAAATAPPVPALVRVNFTSDPDGATVVRRDGTVLGRTPLSIELPYGDEPINVAIAKPGYAPKTISFVPNMPLPVVAVLSKNAAPGAAAPAPAAAPIRAVRPAAVHARKAHPADVDRDDDVMAPTTW